MIPLVRMLKYKQLILTVTLTVESIKKEGTNEKLSTHYSDHAFPLTCCLTTYLLAVSSDLLLFVGFIFIQVNFRFCLWQQKQTYLLYDITKDITKQMWPYHD